MTELVAHLRGAGLTQAQAARHLGVTQPRISDPTRGKIDLFSIDMLINMAVAAGLRVDIPHPSRQLTPATEHSMPFAAPSGSAQQKTTCADGGGSLPNGGPPRFHEKTLDDPTGLAVLRWGWPVGRPLVGCTRPAGRL